MIIHTPQPVVLTAGSRDPAAPLVVLLHGRGSSERDIINLAANLPPQAAYAAVRAPITEGGGYAWFANRGIGRPVPSSLRQTMDWFTSWLDTAAPAGRDAILLGFSGGAAFAGGLLLDQPARYAGAAILYGTLPFDAGVPLTPGRLTGVPVLVAQGQHDTDPPPRRTRHHHHHAHRTRRLAHRTPHSSHARKQRAAYYTGGSIFVTCMDSPHGSMPDGFMSAVDVDSHDAAVDAWGCGPDGDVHGPVRSLGDAAGYR
jgi:phospholipase/carboxylesterase